ncbi:MAG: hypothetical protein ACI8T1_002326 [Verrucomicrobiales bacterium]|jgi:hypothetical protein
MRASDKNDTLSTHPLLFGGLAIDSKDADELDRVSEFLSFDRGALGFQTELPDSVRAESRTPTLIVRKNSSEKLLLRADRTRWHYLTAEMRREIRGALQQVGGRQWRRLVVHSSASETGNATLLDADQRRRRSSLKYGAYHFTIGNGSYSADGEIELGQRWIEQQPGAAMGIQELNAESLSVCLIGSFRESGPRLAQWQALDELLAYLRAQLGPLSLSAHGEVESTASSCPGPGITTMAMQQLSDRS